MGGSKIKFFPYREEAVAESGVSLKDESVAMRSRIESMDAKAAEEQEKRKALEQTRAESLTARREANHKQAVQKTKEDVAVAKRVAEEHAASSVAKAKAAAETAAARETEFAAKAADRKRERNEAKVAAFKESVQLNRERVEVLNEKRKKSDGKKNDRLAGLGVIQRPAASG